MAIGSQKSGSWKRPGGGIWPALAITAALHVALLFVTVERDSPAPPEPSQVVDISLVTPAPPEPVVVEPPPPAPEPRVADRAVEPPATEPPLPNPEPPATEPAPASVDVVDLDQLAPRIKAAPWLDDDTPESVFGDNPAPAEPLPDFRWAERTDMITMLDQPLPALPFADPDLVDFAYAPGVMGSMHRGFDKITPEFGWTSKTGFKVRCKLILIVVGCGWGR